MNLLEQKLSAAKSAAIMGHIRPDGDCIGSCLGLKHYILEKYPDMEAHVYLDYVPDKFLYLPGSDSIITEGFSTVQCDLAIILDCSDEDRLEERFVIVQQAKDRICIDHHITNNGSIAETILESDASSTCEVLYKLMDKAYISKAVAECIYTGIIHDTGIFKYPATSPETLRIAADLMEKGINHTYIQDVGFYQKTYTQNQVLGRTLLESVLFLDGKCMFSYLSRATMRFYGVTSQDLEGIVSMMRDTVGVEVSIFFYEVDTQTYKVSLRSNDYVDVSRIAAFFGGGGHIRAAGCTMHGSAHDVVNNLSSQIARQMNVEKERKTDV